MANPRGRQVDLLGTVEVLHRHLTDALCAEVFEEVRTSERRRRWTLENLTRFWAEVILRAPPSLTHALEEASAGGGRYPRVAASKQAFFSRSQTLTWEFFQRLFERFAEEVRRAEKPRFFAEGEALRARFRGTIWALDGSALDPVARRLKALWDDKRVALPGSIVAFYDLSTGTVARLRYETTPLGKEAVVAKQELAHVPSGGLMIADRLFGTPTFFEALSERGLYGLIRRHGRPKMEVLETLSRVQRRGRVLTDEIVRLGTSRRVPAQTLRRIRLCTGGKEFELLTNVLDPQILSAEEALALYARRWRVERLFFELKEVLNLHRFYAANVNAVAAQVYAAALVHVALRAAQGRIAHEAKIPPERLSTQKLFPKVAAASAKLTDAENYFDAVCAANTHARLTKPSWRTQAFARAPLASVLASPRRTVDRKKRPKPGRGGLRALPPAPPRPAR
jgi:Transposase DDE domain